MTSSDPSVTAWAEQATSRLSALPDVHRVGIALTEGGGRRLRFTSSDRLAGDADAAWCLVDAYDEVPLTTAVRTGQPVLGGLDDLEHAYAGFVQHLRTTPTVALAAVPVVAAGQVLGAVVVYYDAPQPFDEAQVAALVATTRLLGSALRRAQRRRGRRTSAFAEDSVPPGARVADHEVPSAHRAVPRARSFLADVLRDWEVPDAVAADAVLCLSELVTNALVHSWSGCSVRAVLDSDVLTVAVRDDGVHRRPALRPADDVLRVHGRGLQIVEAIATRWGSDLDDRGLTVWFTLELAPDD